MNEAHNIHSVAAEGSVKKLNKMIKREGRGLLEKPNRYGQTPLIVAGESGNLDVIRDLVKKHKVNVNSKDVSGKTTVHYLCKHHTNKEEVVEVISLLIDHGAKDLEKNLPLTSNPFMTISSGKFSEEIALLFIHKNCINNSNVSPVHLQRAVERNWSRTANKLVHLPTLSQFMESPSEHRDRIFELSIGKIELSKSLIINTSNHSASHSSGGSGNNESSGGSQSVPWNAKSPRNNSYLGASPSLIRKKLSMPDIHLSRGKQKRSNTRSSAPVVSPPIFVSHTGSTSNSDLLQTAGTVTGTSTSTPTTPVMQHNLRTISNQNIGGNNNSNSNNTKNNNNNGVMNDSGNNKEGGRVGAPFMDKENIGTGVKNQGSVVIDGGKNLNKAVPEKLMHSDGGSNNSSSGGSGGVSKGFEVDVNVFRKWRKISVLVIDDILSWVHITAVDYYNITRNKPAPNPTAAPEQESTEPIIVVEEQDIWDRLYKELLSICKIKNLLNPFPLGCPNEAFYEPSELQLLLQIVGEEQYTYLQKPIFSDEVAEENFEEIYWGCFKPNEPRDEADKDLERYCAYIEHVLWEITNKLIVLRRYVRNMPSSTLTESNKSALKECKERNRAGTTAGAAVGNVIQKCRVSGSQILIVLTKTISEMRNSISVSTVLDQFLHS